MTYYDILGISYTARDNEIKKAYHQMIIAFHPDKYQGDKQFAAKKTHEIIEAYKTLCNPTTRKTYDELISSQVLNPTGHTYTNTSASASGYQSRKDVKTNRSAFSHFWNTKSQGIKAALCVIGILFVVFVLAFFILVVMYASKL